MTEKIEWYKEVLELEPNSKVFFPLARMLANEGATEEAIDIIEKGLVRHPEFLEARLYCIELLHKCGRVEACQAHVERLSKMLSAYGEFWRAWASCIAAMKESGSEDTAAALRFLAANFLHGPISLNKIIEDGLAAVLGEKRPGEAAQAAMVAPAPAVAPAGRGMRGKEGSCWNGGSDHGSPGSVRRPASARNGAGGDAAAGAGDEPGRAARGRPAVHRRGAGRLYRALPPAGAGAGCGHGLAAGGRPRGGRADGGHAPAAYPAAHAGRRLPLHESYGPSGRAR